MKKSKGILSTDLFYVDHLDPDSEIDQRAIYEFYIADEHGQGLDFYFKYTACSDEENRKMRTYIVRLNSTDECVGYFSLKAGLISLNESEIETSDNATGEKSIIREFDTLPGVELADFAVNSTFITKYPYYKGVGQVIFTEFVIPTINEAAKHIGISIVYIFALPYDKLISRYMDYGFQKLSDEAENALHKRLKPRYDEHCKFMYQLL